MIKFCGEKSSMAQKKISKTYNYDPEIIRLIKTKAEMHGCSESVIARYLMRKAIEREQNERKS
jgi:hypothetical protein